MCDRIEVSSRTPDSSVDELDAGHDAEGCLVRVCGPANEILLEKRQAFYEVESSEKISVSVSGVIFPRFAVVLTVASVFEAFLKPNSGSGLKQRRETSISLLENILRAGTTVLVSVQQDTKRESSAPVWYPARLVHVYEPIIVQNNMETRLVGKKCADPSEIRFTDMAVLAVDLRTRRSSLVSYGSTLPLTVLKRSWAAANGKKDMACGDGIVKNDLKKGDAVGIIASPFGLISPALFRNNFSGGTISNVVTNESGAPIVLLTDAATYPGSAGGAVVRKAGDRWYLKGLLASPLARDDGSFLEMAVIIPIESVLTSLIRSSNLLQINPRSLPFESPLHFMPTAAHGTVSSSSGEAVCERALVCVKVGSSWGSGIICNDSGLILTCEHLIEQGLASMQSRESISHAPKIMVRTNLSDHWQRAFVVHRCKGTLDVAFIRAYKKLPSESAPAKFLSPLASGVRAGDPVIALGHAIFDPATRLPPTFVSGFLSKTAEFQGQPMIRLTSASIFRGDSGGLIATPEGIVIGMITSNARQDEATVFPKINFSIAAEILHPATELTDAYDLEAWFLQLDQMSARGDLAELWKLENTERELIDAAFAPAAAQMTEPRARL